MRKMSVSERMPSESGWLQTLHKECHQRRDVENSERGTVKRGRDPDEDTEIRPGRRCIRSDQTRLRIHPVSQKRNEKRENGIPSYLYGIQSEEIPFVQDKTDEDQSIGHDELSQR